MTDDERAHCRVLFSHIDYASRVPADERIALAEKRFLDGCPAEPAARVQLGLKWLREAIDDRSAGDLDWALPAARVMGLVPEHKEIFVWLLTQDWHARHEDLVDYMQAWKTPDLVEPLFGITQWLPTDFAYDDEARALACRATYALGKIPGPEAQAKLEILAGSDNEWIRARALEELEHRRSEAR